jgi:hypothetical protein
MISVSLTLPLTIVVVHAQGVDSFGDIRGTVTDTSAVESSDKLRRAGCSRR